MAIEAAGALARFKLLDGIGVKELRALEQRCRFRHYARGTAIVDYEADETDVFFIINGKVRVTIFSAAGREVAFHDIEAGELFGELSAIDGKPRSATIVASTDCVLAALPANAFRELLGRQPAVMDALLKRLVGNIRRLTGRVFEFSTLAVRNRIHAELLRLARASGADGPSATITPVPTHSDIASRVSTHREAVTRELNELSRNGVIERAGNGLVVRDMRQLERLVAEGDGA
jgi:CRP/FNR family cyclic AMP-dependent transcriptional regulator